MVMPVTVTRCGWCGSDPIYQAYHDHEWGVPCHDDRKLFEMLVLEGAQAGLNWLTILRKRDGYRRAFAGFDIDLVARFDNDDLARLAQDTGIVRNRLKIAAAVRNARAAQAVRDDFGSLDAYLWQFVENRPKQNRWRKVTDIPAETPESQKMSRELKKRGFTFVGPTICYAFMQATGMVNDHIVDCFRYRQISQLS